MIRLSTAFLLASLLLGCAVGKHAEPVVDTAIASAAQSVSDRAEEVQEASGDITVPVILALREAADSITSEPLPEPVTSIDPAVVALVVRWEVGSPAQYVRKYQGVICPGGASGPTVGIGYDLGTQTPSAIRASFGWHPDVEALVTASGQTGPDRCAAWRSKHMRIRVSYDDAIRVFETQDWPTYQAMAERAYRNGWAALTRNHQGSLTSNGYNRGFSFLGSRRIEMRQIRDRCVPDTDAHCTAAQLRASCRVWEGTDMYAGLCGRRKAEADFAVRE